MEYKCQTISLQKMLYGPQGVIDPLCNDCNSKDCSNTVQWHKISIIGIKKKHRVFIRGNECSAVIQCEGYLP